MGTAAYITAEAIADADRVQVIYGARLAQRRKELGLSQHAVAHLVGVDQTAISQIELGKRRNLPLPLLIEIAAALDVSGLSLLADALRDAQDDRS